MKTVCCTYMSQEMAACVSFILMSVVCGLKLNLEFYYLPATFKTLTNYHDLNSMIIFKKTYQAVINKNSGI